VTRRSVDHALIGHLLQDETLSYREIARRAQCSDFSVRAIAHALSVTDSGDDPPTEPLTLREWSIGAVVMVLIFGGIWLLARRLPPPDGGAM
jgi:hypothetical protein